MSSALDTARATIEARLNTNWQTTAIAWPGVPFSPGASDWIEADIIWGDAFPESRDTAKRNEVVGVLNINLYTRPGSGLGALYDHADTLRDLFQHERLDSGSIVFGAASGPRRTNVRDTRFILKEDTRWEVMNLSIPFRVSESA